MDAAPKPEKSIRDAMKNLKIDPPSKASSVNLSGPKDASASDATSCISSGDATSSIKESEVDQEAGAGEQGMCYYGYCYPGLNGPYGEWDAKGYVVGTDGLEMRPTAIQADNGSFIYYMPSFQPGYNPYTPYLPGAIVGFDGQYFDQQLYYASPASPQSFVSPGPLPQPVAYGPELVPAYPWDPSLHIIDGLQGNTYSGDRANPSPKPNFSSLNQTVTPSKSKPTAKPTSETKGSLLTSNMSRTSVIQNQPRKPVNKAAAVLPETYLPINKFLSYSNQGKGGLLPINLKDNGRSWVGSEKLKARNKLNGLGDLDMLNEQNRGPRTSGTKAASNSDVDHVRTFSTEKNDNSSASISIVNKDEYNLPDFPTKYDQASFFVIKSYSEDDVHKSIKYNVWASTPNGNKRLDNAYQLAQEKMAEKGRCPVFLFFSVNASGQFCGVAEMIGPVNFDKNMDFWQQDKWNGFFPVKWHIIKDVPNSQFRHIILENNENKPVTNSRDTQEVKFPQGTEMLNIFKNYSSKTSILDDFGFYENRQKVMQDKRSKPHTPNIEHLMLKTDEVIQTTKSYDMKTKVCRPPLLDIAAGKNEEEPKAVIAPEE